jgi:hypothetical protein
MKASAVVVGSLFVVVLLVFVLVHAKSVDAKFDTWGTATKGIQMSIKLKEENTGRVEGTNPITLSIRVRNISTNEIWLFLCDTYADRLAFSFVVVTPSGKVIQPMSKGGRSGNGYFVEVFANKTNEFEINLRDLFKFDEAGTYMIISRIDACLLKTNKGFIVTSAPTFFHVGGT